MAARSLAAVVKGFAEFEPGVRVAGVVANQAGSPRHAAWLAEALAAASLPPLLGAIPRCAAFLAEPASWAGGRRLGDAGRPDVRGVGRRVCQAYRFECTGITGGSTPGNTAGQASSGTLANDQ